VKNDLVTIVALAIAFAILVTAHLAIVVGLLRRSPRWRAPVALVVPPLAPFWAWREKMRVRGIAWVVGGVAYVIALTFAMRH
jgi:hypothetical protein